MTDIQKIIKILLPELLALIDGQNSSDLPQKGLDNKRIKSIHIVEKGVENDWKRCFTAERYECWRAERNVETIFWQRTDLENQTVLHSKARLSDAGTGVWWRACAC